MKDKSLIQVADEISSISQDASHPIPIPDELTVERKKQALKQKIIKQISTFIVTYIETAFVVLILLAVAIITFFIDEKLAFLNVFYLPIVGVAYYSGQRLGVIGAFMTVVFVFLTAILTPDSFIFSYNEIALYSHLSAWGGFLILVGYVVGRQKDSIKNKMNTVILLNKDLHESQKDLATANINLKKYNTGLEQKVSERTEKLNVSLQSIQTLKIKVEETLYSTMDEEVVKLIMNDRLRSEKRTISIMFSDLAGFTFYSEDLSPEIIVKDLNR